MVSHRSQFNVFNTQIVSFICLTCFTAMLDGLKLFWRFKFFGALSRVVYVASDRFKVFFLRLMWVVLKLCRWFKFASHFALFLFV